MEEIWRPVVGFEGHYEVSSESRVRSISYKGKQRVKYLKPILRGRYYCVNLVKEGRKNIKLRNIHTLVARAFPEICGEWFDGCVVDHLDGNAFNNKASNLHVTTQLDNIRNPISSERRIKAVLNKCSVPIIAYKEDKVLIFNSVSDAERYFGIKHGAISNCLNGRAKTSCGYQWKYA